MDKVSPPAPKPGREAFTSTRRHPDCISIYFARQLILGN
jgi:hypothetical protein